MKLLPTPEANERNANPRMTKTRSNGQNVEPNLAGIISTSSPGASPASPFPMPEREKEQATTATSGRRCFELYQNFGPAGLSVRTCAEYLLSKTDWYSNVCALTWKASATPFKRLLCQLVPRARRTDGTEFGLLQTPAAAQGLGGHYSRGGKRKGELLLAGQIAMLPTPSTKDVSGGAVEAIPTATGFKRVSKQGKSHGAQLHDVMKYQAGQNRGLKLQPAFALWMMGFPENWCDLDGE